MGKREQWETIANATKEVIAWAYEAKELIDSLMEIPLFKIGTIVGIVFFAIAIGKKIYRKYL